MGKVVIKAENISKLYRLGEVGTGSFAQDLNRWWAKIRGKEDPFAKVGSTNDRTVKGDSQYVWALKDISFNVNQGEVLGIIGRNGAGKSTLLKILSRTTTPTKGGFRAKGRIASLLEVGTGFHPDLSGRDNIFLNGAILGMTKSEIKGKFDEIVAFAGVERYIDTPVKRYSSGMYVRLAFAVAAHLESEILIIDEVLAVGDAEFQNKCLGKMGDVANKEGRTVLFVSHNMAAVKSLCSRAIMLGNGILTHDSDVDTIVSSYLKSGSQLINYKRFEKELSLDDIVIKELKIQSSGKEPSDPIIEGEEIEFCTSVEIKNNSAERYHITYHLNNELGDTMFSFSHVQSSVKLMNGLNKLICKFPGKFFNTGSYYLTLLIIKDKKEVVLSEKDIVSFTIANAPAELGAWMGREPGFLKPVFDWSNNLISVK